jgi:hypothetical protein
MLNQYKASIMAQDGTQNINKEAVSQICEYAGVRALDFPL